MSEAQAPVEFMLDQILGIAYRKGILQTQREAATEYLADRFERDSDVADAAAARLPTYAKAAKQDFISRAYHQFITAALGRMEENV